MLPALNRLCIIVKHDAADVFVKSVIAVESSRVALQQIRGVEGSDYINASYIDVRCNLTNTIWTLYFTALYSMSVQLN